jgi:hypothetical protein
MKTFVPTIDMTALLINEKPVSLWSNSTGKVQILLTNQNVWLLTEPTVAGNAYAMEKVVLPTFITGESISDFYFDSLGKPLAMVTNRWIYTIKTT